MCVKQSHGYIIYSGSDPREEWRDHRLEISIESKIGMKCVAARSIKSAIEFVFAHVKDTGRLAYWNLRGVQFFSMAWIPTTTFDYLCVWGGG